MGRVVSCNRCRLVKAKMKRVLSVHFAVISLMTFLFGCAAEPSNASREIALRELKAAGADIDYALNILPDGTDPPGRVRRVRFRSGTCTDESLRYVASLAELEQLDLYQQPVTDYGLRYLSRLANLRSLELGRTRVTGAGLRHLAALRRLEALFLEGLFLDESAFRHIAQFERLRTLGVDETSLDDSRLMLLTPLRNLEYLHAFDTTVTDAGAARFGEVLPQVTVHRFEGQESPSRPPTTRPVKPVEWSRDLVKQTFLWPHNFLSGSHWEGQGLDHREITAVLEQRLPGVDKNNAERPAFEVVAEATNRRIVWIPAEAAEDRTRHLRYWEAVGESGPTTVGELFLGLLTFISEAGGPRGVSVVGRRKGSDDADADANPYLIYTLYVTKDYIAIVALPADGE
jgi:hypothetical protein